MGAAIRCDNCGVYLDVKPNGDDENGERAGWLSIEAANQSWDLCTRSCAVHLLDDPESPLVVLLDEWQEVIAGIVHTIQRDAMPDGDT